MAGLTDISVANYTVLYYTTDVGVTWTPITNVNGIGELTDEKTIIDVQEYGVNYLRKLVGTANAGAIDLTVNFSPADTSHQYLLASYKSGASESFRLVMFANAAQAALGAAGAGSSFVLFNGFVGSKSTTNEFDAARTATFSIAVDGAIGDITAQ